MVSWLPFWQNVTGKLSGYGYFLLPKYVELSEGVELAKLTLTAKQNIFVAVAGFFSPALSAQGAV